MPRERKFHTEHVARKPRGWRVRTVTPGDGRHQVRIAFPPGPRRTGAGRVLEILHPRGENPECHITPATAGGIAETVLKTQNPFFVVMKRFGNEWGPFDSRGAAEAFAKKGLKKGSYEIREKNPGAGELVVLGLGNPKRGKSPEALAVALERSYDLPKGHPGRRKAKREYQAAAKASLKARVKRNPGQIEQAADLYREFHGKEPGELLKIQQTAELRKDYAALGPLLSLRGSVGSSRWEITFDRDKPMLASSPDGHQLYILGGDQNIDACLGQMETDAERDFVDLGKVKQVVYFARKAAGNFEPIEWEHDFEDPLPRAHYDRLNQRIAITGGAYYIEAPGIID